MVMVKSTSIIKGPASFALERAVARAFDRWVQTYVALPPTRQVVSIEATRPKPSCRSASVSVPLMRVAPSATTTAETLSTRPRASTGHFQKFRNGAQYLVTRPVGSARFRRMTTPACDTTPRPSAETVMSVNHRHLRRRTTFGLDQPPAQLRADIIFIPP